VLISGRADVWSPSADRVVHADDGLIVREGVRRLLEIDRDVEVVASRGDLGTLLEAVEVQLPDVVMTDTRMLPDSSDRAFVRRSCCRRRIRVSLTTALTVPRTCSPRAHPWHVFTRRRLPWDTAATANRAERPRGLLLRLRA
jgi:CheY-like chemotaxis protein